MSNPSDGGLAASTSQTTSEKHNRTDSKLQDTIDSESLTIEKGDCSLQADRGQPTTIVSTRDNDSSCPSRAMQWTLLVVVTIITLATLVVPLVFAILKGQALLAIPSVGTLPLSYVWVRLARFVFPVNEKDHEYRMAKLCLNCLGQGPEEQENERIREHKQLIQDNTDNAIL